jgi:hypothetical protein
MKYNTYSYNAFSLHIDFACIETDENSRLLFVFMFKKKLFSKYLPISLIIFTSK